MNPQEARASVLEEELAKGSDPRVAEGRSKAAEARARQGYPIDPTQAWKVKLEKESGRAPKEISPSSEPEPVASEPLVLEEPPPPAPPAPPAIEAEPRAAIAAPVALVPVVAPEPAFEPEFGQLLEAVDEDRWTEIGGVKVRDARIPTWLMVVLIAIPLWAIVYLMALGSGDVHRATTGCVVDVDHTFVCFQPFEEGAPEAGH